MKKLMSSNVICVGGFCGPDIEEGTFHEPDAATDSGHKGKTTPRCPCPPAESPGAIVPEDTNEGHENDAASND